MGSWLILTLIVWFLFPHVTLQKNNKPTKNLLHSFESERNLIHATEIFSRFFNKILGATHFSWHCLLWFSILSLICGGIIALLRISFHPTDISYINLLEYVDYLETLFFFVMTMIVFNFLPGFLALLKTRLILQKLKNNPRNYNHWFLLDFEITLVLAIFPWLIGISIEAFFRSYYLRFEELSDYLFNTLLPLNSSLAIAFYATFFSWGWLWLFIFSSKIIHFINTVKLRKPSESPFPTQNIDYTACSMSNVVNQLLRKEQQDYLSVRLVSIIIITLLYLITYLAIG